MKNFNTFSTLNNNNLKKLSRKDKLALVLSQDQIEILNGSMLGDLHAEKRNLKGNTRLQFKYSSISKDYVYHLYNMFKDFTGSPPIQLSHFDSRPNDPNFRVYKVFVSHAKRIFFQALCDGLEPGTVEFVQYLDDTLLNNRPLINYLNHNGVNILDLIN
jgi:hypothetical protein